MIAPRMRRSLPHPARVVALGSLVAAAALVAYAVFVGSAHAVTVRNAQATERYLDASEALERSVIHNAAKGIAAVEALAKAVELECPLVLSKAPFSEEKTTPSERDVLEELVGTATYAYGHADAHAPAVTFYDDVRRLRWSDASLTRALHAFALEEVVLSDLRPPDTCTDMKSWVESDYTAEPSGTRAFLHRIKSAESTAKVTGKRAEGLVTTFDKTEYIAKHLRPYETPAERRVARRVLAERAARLALKGFGRTLESFLRALMGTVPPAST